MHHDLLLQFPDYSPGCYDDSKKYTSKSKMISSSWSLQLTTRDQASSFYDFIGLQATMGFLALPAQLHWHQQHVPAFQRKLPDGELRYYYDDIDNYSTSDQGSRTRHARSPSTGSRVPGLNIHMKDIKEIRYMVLTGLILAPSTIKNT
jgi:hypothetical protein